MVSPRSISGSSCSRDSPPRGACRFACRERRPCLFTQYATVEGSRSTARAIASIDSPAASRCASQSLSMGRTLVRVTDGKWCGAGPENAPETTRPQADSPDTNPDYGSLVNKMPASAKEARTDLDGLEELVADAHGLVTIEDDQRAAQRAGDFSWTDAPETWQRSLRRAHGRPGGGLAGARAGALAFAAWSTPSSSSSSHPRSSAPRPLPRAVGDSGSAGS